MADRGNIRRERRTGVGRDAGLCLVIADRRQHEAPVLCGAAYGPDQLAATGGAGGNRGGTSRGTMIVIYTLLAMGCILIASGIWLNFFRELPSFPAHPVDIDPQKGRVK